MSMASGAEFSADESGRPALLRKKKKKVKGEKRQPGKPRAAAQRSLEDPPPTDATVTADGADTDAAGAEGAGAGAQHVQEQEDKNPAVI